MQARGILFGGVMAAAGAMALAETPLPRADATFRPTDPDEVALGQLLFYDPILSGNKTVSCATCHHPKFATSDGVSLGVGDGGIGLGSERRSDPDNPPEQRIPRHSPALFNLGATEFTRFFHDGRLEDDPNAPNGIRTPLGADMVVGFDNALAAQTMFPVLSPDEMAGHYSENDVSTAVRRGMLAQPGGAWDIIAARVAGIPEYRKGFDTFLGTDAPITFADISNALAAFIAFEWRADNSRFDQYLRGETTLTAVETTGMDLFYGPAQCGTCHAGQFQTDHDFHALAMPQIGPGKSARFERHARDTGRLRVTGDPADAFAFRTPSLRNVTRTAPYGHSGAFPDLDSVIQHHMNAVQSLRSYDISAAILPAIDVAPDDRILQDADEIASIAAANTLPPIDLNDADIAAIIAFLGTLEDQQSLTGRLGIPGSVPSHLPIDR
jgi:cytochrome c peroxidase